VIRILADENVPTASIEVLRVARIDTRSVAEAEPGIKDSAVLERALVDNRLLVTFAISGS
jgi:phosphoribosylanthranilate isomerase